MSVNITVNGKYIKTCPRLDLLHDPERVKKEIENERRKMRIQQVRALSKNIAKKVRTDVELEKERQLKKIEEIKAQEMEMWRQNVLAQKEKHFRSSIFQVGAAHRAAQAENSKQTLKKMQGAETKKHFKRSKNSLPTNKLDKENILKNANVQTDITGKCYPKPPAYVKNIKTKYFESSSKPTTLKAASEWEGNSSDYSSDSSQTSLISLSSCEDVSKSPEPNQRKSKTTPPIQKTVSVLLEVDPEESDTSLLESPKTEVFHKASKTPFGRHVSKVTPKPQESSNKRNIPEEIKSTTEDTAPSISTVSKKRFTQISDIIRQQRSSDTEQSKSQLAGPSTLQKSPHKLKSPSSRTQSSPNKPRGKSPSNLRPVSTQTSATQVSKASSSSRSTNTRVQFFDYNNKFHKQCDQPISVVEIHKPTTTTLGSELNAMEQAAIEDRLRQEREVEMEKLRQKSTERCQKAMEREQVRRACEELTAKLDALTKQRQILPSDNHQFASHRLQQVAAEKETKLNNAVEEILRRPAVITCPVIDRHEPEAASKIHQPRNDINGLNLGSAFTQSKNNSLNSSDSCCSILLGYVDGHSKKVADDIQKYSNQNGQTDKAKAEKLQNLLKRINSLRENLMKELEKCSASDTNDNDRVQTMMDSINAFRKEHANILIDDKTEDSIAKRENDLKKKEAVLEKKLREFYEMHKEAKKNNKLKNAQEESSNLQGKLERPTEQKESEKLLKSKKSHNEKDEQKYIQKAQTKTTSHTFQGASNKDLRTEEKESVKDKRSALKEILVSEQESSFQSEEESDDEFVERQEVIVGQNPVEILIKVKGQTKPKKVNRPSKSPRKLSTLIQSPTPKKVRRKVTTAHSVDSNSTSYRSLPNKIHNNVDKLLKSSSKNAKKQLNVESQSDPSSKDEEKDRFKKKSSNLNPLMAHYVQRLLGMSRTSINALGVTSSDIETPSSSIINTTANLSAAETEKLASNRLENVQKFIEDNYSFIDELEESLRQSNSTDSSLKTIEVAWKKALKEENKKKKDTVVQEPLRPSLKYSSKKKKTDFKKDKQPIALVDKSTQMTDNCTQRIAELTEMIKKVRKEKLKILETTLSSASENGRNSTEYLDLPDRQNNSEGSTSRILDSQLVKSEDNLQTQSPESAPRLEKDKPTGMSRDSGISLSRPITVQESRDSPIDDIRPVQSSTEWVSGQFKKAKPPISIARYSPQLPEDIPHELSTIFEVDTPATSRLNTSVYASNGQDSINPVKEHTTQQITYKKFPSFEEYARINLLDMTQFDPEFSVQFEKEFNEFINLAKEGKVADYEEFTSFSKYLAKSSSSENKEAAEELLASLKLANLSYKKFPTRKEYLDKIGISSSDMLDSKSLDNVEESKHLDSNSSSSTSLLNIENELKLRDILTKSFQLNPAPNDKRGLSSITSSSLISQNNKKQGDISGIRQFTTGATSTDEQSANLEDDLKSMGIKWPSTMKKKTMETQALSSSNSSNVDPVIFTNRRKPVNVGQTQEASFQKRTQTAHETTTTLTEDSGQQLNLREFLKKELLKRTTTSSSFSFSDDSVASSILRSILGSITPSSREQQLNGAGVPTLDRHKTSTPMASQSISSAKIGSKSQGGTSSIQLFSGESRLSSVHFNNSSKDVNKNAEKNIDTNISKST